MDMATRQKLAALIQRDIDQLREKAEGWYTHETCASSAGPAARRRAAFQATASAGRQPFWMRLLPLAVQLLQMETGYWHRLRSMLFDIHTPASTLSQGRA